MSAGSDGLTPDQYEVLFGERPPPPPPPVGAKPTSFDQPVADDAPPPPVSVPTLPPPKSQTRRIAQFPGATTGQAERQQKISNSETMPREPSSTGISHAVRKLLGPSQSVKKSSPVWVPSGGSFEIDGLTINGGMVFFGEGLASVDGHHTEPALINPRLPINWHDPDSMGTTMGYWPSYDSISPEARAAYLAWLGNGRRDPDAYIGFVFLFFYGLERRILTNIHAGGGRAGIQTLLDELELLLEAYGHNNSFHGYAMQLIDFAGLTRPVTTDLRPPKKPVVRSWEVPFQLRLGLGQFALAGRPIPCDWALSYLHHDPGTNLRTAAKRCASEFDHLFEMRYATTHGEGILVEAGSAKLSATYRPASGGIRANPDIALNAPDLIQNKALINKLRVIAEECTDDLDSYSRFIGRYPDQAASLNALALLPTTLLRNYENDDLTKLKAWCEEAIAGDKQVLRTLDELVEAWSPGRREKLNKRDAVSLSTLLSKVGIGMEPDVRFGAATPKPGSYVALFKVPEDAPTAPSDAYAAASALVHLTAVIASADGQITSPEQLHMASYLEDVLRLESNERLRLEAYLSQLGTAQNETVGVKKKVAALAPEDLAAVGRFLVDLAAADGEVCPDEITALVKMFPYLGLSESSVYSAIHSLSATDAGPVQVASGDQSGAWKIPQQTVDEPINTPRPASATVKLDMAKVMARQKESAVVAELLADIFVEEEPVPEAAAAANRSAYAAPGPAIEGLDSAHVALARMVVDAPSCTRLEAAEHGESLGLPFVDSALDTINEASFDLCGEPLIDGLEQLRVNPYAKEAIFQ